MRKSPFRYKDYRDGSRHKALSLDGTEFVRCFLLHVLPKGLMRIRHFGFLANHCRRQKLACIRRALALVTVPQTAGTAIADSAIPDYRCPQCREGRLYVIAPLPPLRRWDTGRP